MPPVLAASEVTVRFGGLTALDRVSLTADTGEVVGVIGPNGAGKTTLFNVICGFVRPSSGRIEVDGRPVPRVRAHQLVGMGIARTLQGVGLWQGMTVLDNVMVGAQAAHRSGFLSALLGLPPSVRSETKIRAAALETLSRLGIADAAGHRPAALPYAIQKRASLARALVAEPRMLLLDEPASGLSSAEMSELGQLIRELSSSMGVMLVEHHMDLVMTVCDRIVVLDFGAVIASGTPDQVRGDPAVTAAYLGQEVQQSHAGPIGGSDPEVLS